MPPPPSTPAPTPVFARDQPPHMVVQPTPGAVPASQPTQLPATLPGTAPPGYTTLQYSTWSLPATTSTDGQATSTTPVILQPREKTAAPKKVRGRPKKRPPESAPPPPTPAPPAVSVSFTGLQPHQWTAPPPPPPSALPAVPAPPPQALPAVPAQPFGGPQPFHPYTGPAFIALPAAAYAPQAQQTLSAPVWQPPPTGLNDSQHLDRAERATVPTSLLSSVPPGVQSTSVDQSPEIQRTLAYLAYLNSVQQQAERHLEQLRGPLILETPASHVAPLATAVEPRGCMDAPPAPISQSRPAHAPVAPTLLNPPVVTTAPAVSAATHPGLPIWRPFATAPTYMVPPPTPHSTAFSAAVYPNTMADHRFNVAGSSNVLHAGPVLMDTAPPPQTDGSGDPSSDGLEHPELEPAPEGPSTTSAPSPGPRPSTSRGFTRPVSPFSDGPDIEVGITDPDYEEESQDDPPVARANPLDLRALTNSAASSTSTLSAPETITLLAHQTRAHVESSTPVQAVTTTTDMSEEYRLTHEVPKASRPQHVFTRPFDPAPLQLSAEDQARIAHQHALLQLQLQQARTGVVVTMASTRPTSAFTTYASSTPSMVVTPIPAMVPTSTIDPAPTPGPSSDATPTTTRQ